MTRGIARSLLFVACAAAPLAAATAPSDARGAPGKPTVVATKERPAKPPLGDESRERDAAIGEAKPKPTFEALLADAQPANDLADLLEPLFAECKQHEDFEQRQCEQIRAFEVARLRATKWHALADRTALAPQPYDADAKTLTLGVTGCLACAAPPSIDGAPRLVATKVPRSFEEGVPVGVDLAFHDLGLPDAKRAAFFREKVEPRLRVEVVFGIGAPFEDKAAKGTKGVSGVTVIPLGHRIVNVCNGDVLASVPPSEEKARIAGPRDPICPAADAPSDEEQEVAKAQAQLPDTLTRADIGKAMQPVQQHVYECGEEFDVKQGVARVRLEVTGEGKVTHSIDAPYDKEDIGLCIKAALRDVKFPAFKSRSPAVKINYTFYLRR